MDNQQSGKKAICKHKVGDNWETSCCGDDAPSEVSSTAKTVDKDESQSRTPSLNVAEQ
jgi:hypothetical protein